MSKDKTEDAAKKRVREETEPIKRSDAPGQKPEKPDRETIVTEDIFSLARE